MLGTPAPFIGALGVAAQEITVVPSKIRELIAQLETAGFIDRGGKGSHRNFTHPDVRKPVTISGQLGDDAKHYQTKAVRLALEELKK